MKKILALFVFALTLALYPFNSSAADSAMFSLTSPKTSFQVGDTVQVSLSVDAGPYATTLSTIDLDLKLSESGILEPEDATSPYKPGTIYPSVFNQKVADNIISGVFYINPDSKPASRSGLIATIDFKAIKAGSVTLSYDKVTATQEGSETDYATTSASSLVLNVSSASASATSSSTTDSISTVYSLISPTASVAATETSDTSTVSSGPEGIILISVALGVLLFIVCKALTKMRSVP
jgi:hypothetical protein